MNQQLRRLNLSARLHQILGSNNVYFEPPESIKLNYPCIIYSREKIDKWEADNGPYLLFHRYSMTFITKERGDDVIEKLLELQNCEHNRNFKADDLNHYVFTIYI